MLITIRVIIIVIFVSFLSCSQVENELSESERQKIEDAIYKKNNEIMQAAGSVDGEKAFSFFADFDNETGIF